MADARARNEISNHENPPRTDGKHFLQQHPENRASFAN
jgi:hypothetical protein